MIVFYSFSTIGQTGNSKSDKEIPPPPPPPPSFEVVKKNPNFGNYYKIGKYPIRVPFNEPPHISPGGENNIFKLTGYQYVYPSPMDDVNILYGIDVCEYKSDSSYKTPKARVDYYAVIQKKMNLTNFQGTLISEILGGKDGAYYVRQKMKITSKDIGEVYVTSLYFYFRENVVRLYVFSPNNIDNKRIEDFFTSVEFD